MLIESLSRNQKMYKSIKGGKIMCQNQNIYKKLLEVRKSVPYLTKGEIGSQYAYVSSSQVLSALRNTLDNMGLLLIPKIIGKEVKPIKNNILTELTLEYEWVDVATGEKLSVPFYAQGIDERERGIGKALTYGEKYFLLKMFNIPTDDIDPDAQQPERQNPQQGQQQPKQQNNNSVPVQPEQEARQVEQQTLQEDKYITKEQLKELNSIANELATLRGTSKQNWVIACGVDNFAKLPKSQYKEVKEKLTVWLEKARERTLAEQKEQKQEKESLSNPSSEGKVVPKEKKDKNTSNNQKQEEKPTQIVEGSITHFEIKKRNGNHFAQVGITTLNGDVIGVVALGQENINILDEADHKKIKIQVSPIEGTEFFQFEKII